MIYFSSWHYAAIHMCLMVPELRSRKAISEFLGLTPSVVNKILDFLFQVHLAKEDVTQLSAGPARVHLPHTSSLVNKHHSHWRMRAIDALDYHDKHDLHYSMVTSISTEAAEKIREILLQSIESIETEIKKTADKTVYALTLDLFSLKKN